MHLNQINSFLAISKTLNFTSAARQLGIPQSTISRQINDLEKQLGVRLFYRTRRDVHLTDEGRAFLPYAREMADAAEKGTHAVRQLHEGAAGRLAIAAVPAAERFLSAALEKFHRAYPDIVIDLTPLSSGFTLMEDVDSPYDFCFLYQDMLADSEEYDTITTHQEVIGAVMSKMYCDRLVGSPKSGRIPASDLLPKAGLVLLSEQADPIVYMQAMNYCRTHRIKPEIINTFPEVSSVLLSLRSGLGASILPASLVPEGDDLVFLPLDEKSYTITCIAAWRKSLLNPAAALFREVLAGGRKGK